MNWTLKILLFITGLVLLVSYPVFSQAPPPQSLYDIQPRTLVDAPTAWTLPRGCFDIVMRAYSHGGISLSTAIGFTDRFMVGASYGGEGIISATEPDWNPRIEFNVKLRLIDEEKVFPAFSIGYNSQGFGKYDDEGERYTYKSKGLYAVITRSLYLKSISLGGHAGINYSMENKKDNDEEPAFFFGIDTRFRYNIGFVLEYDLALNDDKSSQEYGRGRGYLNFGVKWLYSENLELETIFKNLLDNSRSSGVDSFGRCLRITYIEFF